jgi:hypothetical protein
VKLIDWNVSFLKKHSETRLCIAQIAAITGNEVYPNVRHNTLKKQEAVIG